MKREVNRERNLPAFSLTIGELELLLQRLSALFDTPSETYISIDMRLPLEQLEFSNIEELKQYADLPARVTNFTVYLSQNNRRISIRSGRLLTARSYVSATSETEAWCAGAIDTVYSFAQTHKQWYSWFVSAPLGWILFLVGNLPAPAFLISQKLGLNISPVVALGWIGTVLALFILYFGRERLLPSAVIRTSESKGFISSYVAELSLVVATISAILTVIGLFISK